jgi:hypothetical protein
MDTVVMGTSAKATKAKYIQVVIDHHQRPDNPGLEKSKKRRENGTKKWPKRDFHGTYP